MCWLFYADGEILIDQTSVIKQCRLKFIVNHPGFYVTILLFTQQFFYFYNALIFKLLNEKDRKGDA